MKLHLHIGKVTIDDRLAGGRHMQEELAAALRGELAPLLARMPGLAWSHPWSAASIEVAPVQLGAQAGGEHLGVAVAQAIGAGLRR